MRGAQERVLRAQRAGRAKGARRVAESELGRRYPSVAATWKRSWDRFVPFLQFPPMLRRVVYTTNSIESLNYQLRKVSRNRSQFPNDQAVVKLFWLAICDIEDKRSLKTRQRRQQNQAQKRGKAHRGTHDDQLETGPRPTRGRIPRTNGTLFINTPQTQIT